MPLDASLPPPPPVRRRFVPPPPTESDHALARAVRPAGRPVPAKPTARARTELRQDVRQIHERLAYGEAKFAELYRKMDSRKLDVGVWERLILEAVRIGQILLVLWLTGSVDAAVRLLSGGR